MKITRIALCASTAVISALILTSCSSGEAANDHTSHAANGQDNTTFRVAYLSTANYLTTLTKDNYLKDQLAAVGAKVEYSGPFAPVDAYNAVTSGNADASSTGTGYFINLVAQKSPWVAFALEKYSGNSQGIVAAPGTGVTSLKDLYGKKIGIDSKGATGDYIVHAAFAAAGLDVSKVTEVPLKTTDFAAAFASGKIDALASFDQNLANAIAVPGAKEIVNGTQFGSLNWSIHIVSRSFAEKHPLALKAAYKALVQESEKAQKNPSIITDTYRQFGSNDASLKVLGTFDTPEILPLDEAALGNLEKQAQQYVDFGFIKSVPDLKNAVVDASK
ncbi:MAG: NrtA/SsuA/CpmA family ABC transporter substrate-binding protein [Gordonia sp. (in: high G+C Gram-positive bacteria)]